MECDSIHAAITWKEFCQCILYARLMIHFCTYETTPYKVRNFHHGDFYDFQKLAKYIMNTDEKMRRGTP